MSMLDPELFDRRNPLLPYDLSLNAPLKAQHGNLTYDFGFIIDSCQDQLAGRSLEEIQFAAEFLNWLMGKADESHLTASIAAIEGGKSAVFQTDPRKILSLFETFDLEDQSDFPAATPEDYFAVLALAKCFEAIETHENLTAYERNENSAIRAAWGNDTPEEIQTSLHLNAIRARDSLMSESRDLVAFIDGIRFAQLRSKNAGKRGAKAKNSPFTKLNKMLMAVYEEKYASLTDRHAASRLYDDYRDEVDHVLRTDDPAHRISKWIGKHKKNKRGQS